MSGGPRFPKQPLAGRDTWFVGADGKNPFTDASAATSGPAANGNGDVSETGSPGESTDRDLFAAPQAPVERITHLYETTMPHRGRHVLWLGRLGFGGALFGILVMGPILWLVVDWLYYLSLVVTTGAMILSAMAWHSGRTDLVAMRAGAMEDAGLQSTLWGKRFGMCGLFLGVAAWLSVLVPALVANLLKR